jgi:hypothetical protein
MSNTEADPDLKADVDLMILDYLACIATNQTFSVAGMTDESRAPNESEEVDWLVDAVRGKIQKARLLLQH